MIYAVANIKGGVGKSTIATNLAIALSLLKRDPMLIDGDEQKTAMGFTKLRTVTKGEHKEGYAAASLAGSNIRSQVLQLAAKYDDIVIDVGASDSGSFRAALTVANVVLIPVKPRSFDLWSVDQTAKLVEEARAVNESLRALVVINEADAQGKDNRAACDDVAGVKGIDLAPVQLVRRKAYPNASASGLSVLEYNDPKAKAEFKQLLDYIFVYTTAAQKVAYGNR